MVFLFFFYFHTMASVLGEAVSFLFTESGLLPLLLCSVSSPSVSWVMEVVDAVETIVLMSSYKSPLVG